ncbi:hypothetical protein [Rhizobium oryzihabitans]|uniref:hypothetical protein n=1 Tax=Rhizobium oryzihabitans TaxID=2267833 RepID=UPI004035FF8C
MQHIGQIPSNDDTAVLRFLTMWGLQGRPILLQYADYGYDAAQCHVSAKHKALSDGGRRVHGWALWMFGDLLLADHHSVWEDSNGNLVDVTPPSNGGEEILFVRDDTARIEQVDGAIQLFTQRTADEKSPWFWQGKSSDYSNWLCPPDKSDLVAYSASLNIPVLDILTDDQNG